MMASAVRSMVMICSLVSPQRYWQNCDYPSQKCGFAGECPERCAANPVHNPQKSVKINIISMYRRLKRRALCQNRSAILPTAPKSRWKAILSMSQKLNRRAIFQTRSWVLRADAPNGLLSCLTNIRQNPWRSIYYIRRYARLPLFLVLTLAWATWRRALALRVGLRRHVRPCNVVPCFIEHPTSKKNNFY